MAIKPDIITQLEKQIGKKLKEKPLEMIMTFVNIGYALGKNREVCGLNLVNSGISNLELLHQLPRLTHLQLGFNKISDVSPLQGLTALTHLYLHSNQLTDVSPLQGLTALTDLDLHNNQLTDVSPLQGLTALTDLYLHNNQLTDVSPLQGLTALTDLRLDFNQLTDVSPLQGLKQLKTLDLKNNKISQWPEAIFHLGLEVTWDISKTWDPGLHMFGNPLETPPLEVVKQGTQAVLNYFKELKKASVRLLQCKLLIVGNGEVGKTTLMNKLLDPNFPVEPGKEDTTRGIHIQPWQLQVPFTESDGKISPDTVTLHFWDFGGQEIYHATHQFFLTKRSLYLFVWEVRREEETRSFDYWLNIIKLLSDQSPVMVVMNKAELRDKFIDEASFKERFLNIQSYHKVSCLTNQGLPELTSAIQKQLASMPHLRDSLPRVWVDIRHHLLEEKKNHHYISLQKYYDICQQHGLNPERAQFLSGYLHNLGTILHYHHDPLLQDTVILDPQWATEAVYALIDTREIMDHQGSFQFDDLKRFWDNHKFPPEKHLHLVRLMETFELCFNFADTKKYFVPELLPPMPTTTNLSIYRESGTLRFIYQYDFMPEGIANRFMARMVYWIHQNYFWKNGVILGFDSSTALVVGEPLNRRITITIRGDNNRELLAIIRSHLEHIHSTLNMQKNTHYYEKIPCLCATCQKTEKPTLFDYEKLQEAFHKGKNQILCLESYEDISIAAMLDRVSPAAPKKDLLDSLFTISMQLQGIRYHYPTGENSRNVLVTTFLSAHGFRVKDQSLWSRSPSGKDWAELDIKVEGPDGRPESIIEAFNLKGLHKTVIDSHLEKIFLYDPHGLNRLFILVYVENNNFTALWKDYMNYITHKTYTYPLQAKPEELDTPGGEIKALKMVHRRQDRDVLLYHIFINMYK